MSKTKLVEVMSRSPFRLRGKIVRAVNREHLTLEEIYACLSQYALVKEVKPDGQLVSLDFSNYDKFPEVITEEEVVEKEVVEETTETEEKEEEVVEKEVVEEQPEETTETEEKEEEEVVEEQPEETTETEEEKEEDVVEEEVVEEHPKTRTIRRRKTTKK